MNSVGFALRSFRTVVSEYNRPVSEYIRIPVSEYSYVLSKYNHPVSEYTTVPVSEYNRLVSEYNRDPLAPSSLFRSMLID